MSKQKEQLAALQALREHTNSEITRLEGQLRERVEPASAADDDSADMAAEIYERGKRISTINTLRGKLHNLDHAIEHAQAGRYGTCEKCAAIIPDERLAVMPETTLCVQCASDLEQGIRRHLIRTSPPKARRNTDTEQTSGSTG